MMMKCVLKDLILISKDGEWGKSEPFDGSVEMFAIRGTDFKDVRFGDTASTPRRHIPAHIAERKRLQPWDVIIEAAGGTKNQITGRTVILRPQLFARAGIPFTCASFSRFIRFNTKICDPEFMFWYLQNLYASGAMHAYHTQHTGVARFQWTTFSDRESLLIPPLPTQRRVAGILSAYDELIENSQRRIKILEAMARDLYREWFVDFRFPGYENHPRAATVLNEIPLGWSGVFGDIAKFDRNGINPFDFPEENFQHYSLPAFDNGRLAAVEVGDTILSGKYLIDGSCVLLSKLNPRIPRVWLPYPNGFQRSIASTEFLVLIPKTGFTREFIYAKCCSSDFAGHFGSLAIGTSTSHQRVKPDSLLGLPSVVPDHQTVARFTRLVAPILTSSENLRSKIQNLRRTRDLLLPRLLSGQIDVEAA